MADCDVDAADLHLVLKPDVLEEHEFSGGGRGRILTEKCIGCGKCARYCRFGAIEMNGAGNDLVDKTYMVDPLGCEGCGLCVEVCPADAVVFEDAVNGKWFVSETRFGPMVHAKLGIAEENSGKLVSLIREKARGLAEKAGRDLIIVDGSPGIGCPVIASVTGADVVLIVTEPTLSGKHDLERVAKLARNFGIEALVCINKADINPRVSGEIAAQAFENGFKVIGELPYDDAFTKAQLQGVSIVEYTSGQSAEKVKDLWRQVVYALG